MAGDWIAIRHDLEEEPETVRIVSAICPESVRNLSERAHTSTVVCGALQRTWRLFDKLTVDGVLTGYTAEWLDSYVGIPGWSLNLQHVGWLVVEEQSLILPNFTNWMGDSAKRRLKDAQRKRAERAEASAKCPQKIGRRPQTVRTTVQESREQKSRTPTVFVPPTIDDVKRYCDERQYGFDPEVFVAYYQARGWMLSNGRKMRCWKSACTTWHGNEGRFGGQSGNGVATSASDRTLEILKRRREREQQ